MFFFLAILNTCMSSYFNYLTSWARCNWPQRLQCPYQPSFFSPLKLRCTFCFVYRDLVVSSSSGEANKIKWKNILAYNIFPSCDNVPTIRAFLSQASRACAVFLPFRSPCLCRVENVIYGTKHSVSNKREKTFSFNSMAHCSFPLRLRAQAHEQ